MRHQAQNKVLLHHNAVVRSSLVLQMIDAVVIRPATMEDAAAISRLLPELGYTASPQDIERRLGRLGGMPDNAVTVAQLGGHVVGLCHVQAVPLLASDGYAEVQALVVAVSSQRMGIGAGLLGRFAAVALLDGGQLLGMFGDFA